MKKFGILISLYYMTLSNEGNKTFAEYLQNLLPYVKQLEDELKNRGTYFGGDQPGMVDYMVWPWGERAEVLGVAFNEKLTGEDVFAALYTWCKAMRSQKAVLETSTERLYTLLQQYKGHAVDYDSI